jgi:hypothetical protein
MIGTCPNCGCMGGYHTRSCHVLALRNSSGERRQPPETQTEGRVAKTSCDLCGKTGKILRNGACICDECRDVLIEETKGTK